MKYLFSEKIYGLFHVSISFDISPKLNLTEMKQASLLKRPIPSLTNQNSGNQTVYGTCTDAR